MSDAPPPDDRDAEHPDLPEPQELPGARISDRVRRIAVAIAVLRYLIPIGALALVPVLLRDNFPLLLLLRPGREMLLLGGGRLRVEGQPDVATMFAAYVPLMIVAIWAFFVVGRAYQTALRTGEGPDWLHRSVPPQRLEVAQRLLVRHGPLVAILGRLVGLPATVLAAAAGVSDVSATRYLVADAIGAVLAFGLVVAVGYGLGQAYERGGVWFTVAGVVAVIAAASYANHWFQRATAAEPEAPSES